MPDTPGGTAVPDAEAEGQKWLDSLEPGFFPVCDPDVVRGLLDHSRALRAALADACDAFVECTGPYAQELAAADLLQWRALANPLLAEAEGPARRLTLCRGDFPAAAGSATPERCRGVMAGSMRHTKQCLLSAGHTGRCDFGAAAGSATPEPTSHRLLRSIPWTDEVHPGPFWSCSDPRCFGPNRIPAGSATPEDDTDA